MVLVSSMCSVASTPNSTGAERRIWVSIQPPYFTRQSCNVLDTLRPLQHLSGRGSVLDSLVESTRDKCHCDWSWHGRQRLKRGVPSRGDTPSRSLNAGS
jgi:hypothetical protein